MAVLAATAEDYAFFDALAPYVWPELTKDEIEKYHLPNVAKGIIQIETMLEVAIANNSHGLCVRDAIHGRDFTGYNGKDYGDAKKVSSCFRQNNIKLNHWQNSYRITNIKNKKTLLRIMAYSKEANQFHYFAIPYSAYKNIKILEIVLDNYTYDGTKFPKGIPDNTKWSKYLVNSFDALSQITPEEANKLHLTK